jgi:hypothetical protein
MIELGLVDDVSNKLRGIDSQIDGMQSGLVDTQSEFDDLGRATTEYGRVAGNEIEGVKDDIDELDKQVEEHADITKKAAEEAAKSWGKIGVAVGGAAVATEAFLRSQQDMYFAADKIAYITDMDRQEVIDLAAELNNLSFSLEDAYGVMEIGARQGLRSRSELAEYARFWDAISTASGEDATDLARRAVALQSVNIQAADLAETTDTLGFVMTHTNVGIGQYLNLIGGMAKKMDAYDLSIEDTAVMLAALEERGLTAEKSTEILQSAMNKAKGDTSALYRELGITEEQIARLNEEIRGGSDYITVMGDAYTETRTSLQWVQTEIGKLAHVLGRDLNPLLEVGSVALTGMSSVMLTAASAAYIYSVASTMSLVPALGAATASAWAFTTALLANPITWIVLGIVGLGAALYLLASNWDSVSGWFMDRWEEVGAVVTGAIDWIGNVWDSTVGAIVAGADWLRDKLQFIGLLFPVTAPIAAMGLLRDNWDTVVGAIGAGWDWLVGAAQDGAAWLGETIGAGLSGIIDLFWQYNPLGIVIRQWDEITGYLEGIDLVETGRDILLGLVRGILDIRQQAIDAVMGIGEDILNAVTGFFGISSPSKLMQEMGGHVGEGFALGVAQSMPESIPLPGFLAGPQPALEVYETASLAPGNPSLVGEIQYTAAIEEPAISNTLTGEVGYHSVFEPPTVEALHRQVLYSPALDEPAIEDLAGTVTYLPTVGEPIVPAISEEATYSTTVSEPVLSPLEGSAIWYSRVTEPTIKPLAGDVQYSSVIAGPDVPALTGELIYEPEVPEPTIGDLTGAITYLAKVVEPVISALTGELIYEPEVREPTIVDRAGTVVYETEMSEPTIAALTGAITYVATVLEPAIPLLTGAVTYLSEVLRPEVPALAGTIEYGATLPEQGNLDRAGEVRYTPTIAEPTIDTLAGVVEYRGVLVGLPDINDLTGRAEFGGREIDDTRASTGPETDNLPDPIIYTPERDAPYMAGERSGDLVYSPTIHVTTGTSDANEIATTVDRRLRQTFDRHAELYFARQRRRAAL